MSLFTSTLHTPSRRGFRAAMLIGTAAIMLSACKPREQTASSTAASDAAPTPLQGGATKAALPPEPLPPVADKVSEVPALEAALAKDAAFQKIWAGTRGDLNSFLSMVSELVATGGIADPLMKAMQAKHLQDAGVKLFMIFGRTGKFPAAFADKFTAHLEATKAEPHAGTWSPYVKGATTWHDYSALASWARPEDPALLREHIAARRDGAGPFASSTWQGKGAVPRPWLVDEGAALDRLALIATLTSDEQVRREALRATAKKEAAAKAEMANAVAVTAGTLFADYSANEVRGDTSYKGKKLLVSGTVADVRKGPFGGIVVGLSTSNQFMPVDASMEDSEAAKAGQLTKGDSVKVLCDGNGLVLGRPQLGDCVFR